MKHNFRKRTSAVLTTLLAGIALLQLVSCNSTTKSYTAICITHFGFDSFPDYKSYTFYIDNFAHTIYNKDSFPFQSKVDSLYPTITAGSDNGSFTMNGKTWSTKDTMDFSDCPIEMKFTAENGTDTYTYNIFVNIHQQDPDSLQMHRISTLPVKGSYRVIYVENKFAMLENDNGNIRLHKSYDCISWDASQPVEIPVTPGAGLIIQSLSYLGKTAFLIDDQGGLYASKVVDKDGNISADGLLTWKKVDNAPYVNTLQGILEGRTYPDGGIDPDALLVIIKQEDGLHLAEFKGYWDRGLSDPGQTTEWYYNEDILPDDFPVRSFACCDDYTQTGLHYVTLVGGIDRNGNYCHSSWSTMTGGSSTRDDYIYWARIATDYSVIGEHSDASMFFYDDQLFLYGGKYTESGGAQIQDTTLYVSTDRGLTWDEADERLAFRPLREGSLCRQVGSDGIFIWVFAYQDGEEGVWKGYINKMLFEE